MVKRKEISCLKGHRRLNNKTDICQKRQRLTKNVRQNEAHGTVLGLERPGKNIANTIQGQHRKILKVIAHGLDLGAKPLKVIDGDVLLHLALERRHQPVEVGTPSLDVIEFGLVR